MEINNYLYIGSIMNIIGASKKEPTNKWIRRWSIYNYSEVTTTTKVEHTKRGNNYNTLDHRYYLENDGVHDCRCVYVNSFPAKRRRQPQLLKRPATTLLLIHQINFLWFGRVFSLFRERWWSAFYMRRKQGG